MDLGDGSRFPRCGLSAGRATASSFVYQFENCVALKELKLSDFTAFVGEYNALDQRRASVYKSTQDFDSRPLNLDVRQIYLNKV